MDGLNIRLDEAKEIINEPKDRVIENMLRMFLKSRE